MFPEPIEMLDLQSMIQSYCVAELGTASHPYLKDFLKIRSYPVPVGDLVQVLLGTFKQQQQKSIGSFVGSNIFNVPLRPENLR